MKNFEELKDVSATELFQSVRAMGAGEFTQFVVDSLGSFDYNGCEDGIYIGLPHTDELFTVTFDNDDLYELAESWANGGDKDAQEMLDEYKKVPEYYKDSDEDDYYIEGSIKDDQEEILADWYQMHDGEIDSHFVEVQAWSFYDPYLEDLEERALEEVERGEDPDHIEELVERYDCPEFNNWQQPREIRLGFIHGLSEAQIQLYARPEFGWEQMMIRCGFENGLNEEQLKLYARSEFKANQMWEIRYGFENGLSMEQVKAYARPEFDEKQMKEIRYGFENGLNEEQVKIFANPEFDALQMEQIRLGLEHGLAVEQFEVFARPEFGWEQMMMIRCGFGNGLNEEQLKLYARSEFKANQMWEIRYGFENGLSMEQVKAYARPEFDEKQMQVIRRGLENGLNEEQMQQTEEKKTKKRHCR